MKIEFRESDFKEFHYSYIFTNETSGTEFIDYQNIIPQDITSTGITLKVLTNSCNTGHNLMIMLFRGHNPILPKRIPKDGRGKGICFSAIAKVLSKTPQESNGEFSFVELRFTQFDKYGWEDIVEEYKDAQEAVSNLMKKIKVNEE